MKKDIVLKIEINIFMIFLFLQNFALIRTSSFGIAALTIFMIYIFVKYKFFMSIDKKFFRFIIVLYSVIILSAIANQFFDFMQIVRLNMIIFVGWSTYKYSKIIQEKDKTEYFYKTFFVYLVIITIYGIYQLVVSDNHWPLFLNIFNNNPSYSTREIYTVYGGWNESPRIYTTFYEPSAYAIFLVNSYFFAIDSEKLTKKQKIALSILAIINVIYSYARSGWITFIYFVGIFILFKILKKDGILKKIGKALVVGLPLITVCIMNIVGLKIFDDLSSKGRTYSSLYYLENSFDNVKSVLVGHGVGSILNIKDGTTYNKYKIEPFAHNGYIDIMYQYGIVFFVFLIYAILKYFKDSKIQDEWLAYASIFTISCFGTMFNVESVIALMCVILSFTKLKKDDGGKLIDEKREAEANTSN